MFLISFCASMNCFVLLIVSSLIFLPPAPTEVITSMFFSSVLEVSFIFSGISLFSSGSFSLLARASLYSSLRERVICKFSSIPSIDSPFSIAIFLFFSKRSIMSSLSCKDFFTSEVLSGFSTSFLFLSSSMMSCAINSDSFSSLRCLEAASFNLSSAEVGLNVLKFPIFYKLILSLVLVFIFK